MDSKQFQEGVDLVKQAIAEDAEGTGDLAKAKDLYERAIQRFIFCLKHGKNKKTNEFINSKINGYFKRAEQLKAELDRRKESALGRASSGAGK